MNVGGAGHIYIAGPMRGIPHFNREGFFSAQERLEKEGWYTFNPAERDLEKYGEAAFASPTGDLADIAHLGFDLRVALLDDTQWICRSATAIYMLNGWEESKGARAEYALALALGLEVYFESSHT